jgi:dihydroorotate dehydrogenase electron transfer subunit
MSVKKLQVIAPVVSNVEIIERHKVITCIAPEIAEQAIPGHFVNVLVTDATDPLLRKPFSIYKVDRAAGEIALLYSIVGATTNGMSRKSAGDLLDIFGPLGGKVFDASNQQISHHILVGGGYGVPPLIFLANTLLAKNPNEKIEFIIGARNKSLVVGETDVHDLGLDPRITTEDGSHGVHGRVTDVLRTLLKSGGARSTMVYCCGPTPMMQAVAEVSAEFGAACQVSLETPMPCGVGVCMGCVVDLADGRRVRSCVDGPVFAGSEVTW